MNCYGDKNDRIADYRVYNAIAAAGSEAQGLTADNSGYQSSHAGFPHVYLNSQQETQQQQFMQATMQSGAHTNSRDMTSNSDETNQQLVITPQTFANFDSQDPEQHKKWMQWINQVKSADRQRLIEQLKSLPETGIVIPPPSVSSTRKQAARPSHVKRPLNAFMVFSKVHRQSVMENDKSMLHKNISKMLGIKWKELSKDEKKLYEIEAQKAKIRHQIEHPDYKYRPKRRVRAKNDDGEDTDEEFEDEEQNNGLYMHYQPQIHAFEPADYWSHYRATAGGYEAPKPSPSYAPVHQQARHQHQYHPYHQKVPTTSPNGYHSNLVATQQSPLATTTTTATAGTGYHYGNVVTSSYESPSSSVQGAHHQITHPNYTYNNTPSSGQSAAPFQPQQPMNGGYNDDVILNLGSTPAPSYTTSPHPHPPMQYQQHPTQYQQLVPTTPPPTTTSVQNENGDIVDYFENNFYTHGSSMVDVPPQNCMDADLVSFTTNPTWYNELE